MKYAFLIGLLFVMAGPVSGQLCTGSLGDPVFQEHFGAGQGSPLAPGISSYTFSGSSCPDEGYYSIGNLSFGCFSSSWHTLVGDHTPNDAGGLFMLVNAGAPTLDFYTTTVTGLCAGTSYELSAWALNMIKPTSCSGNGIDPVIQFFVETTAGVQLASGSSGNIPKNPAPTWNQYGIFFKTPAGVNAVVIKLRNAASGGCGNDLALDDIAIRPCGPSIQASVAGSGLTDLVVCEGTNASRLLLGTYSSGYTNPVFQWQESLDNERTWTDIPGANSTSFLSSPSGNGYFKYRIAIAESGNLGLAGCRINSRPVSILVSPNPRVQLTSYVFGCYGAPVAFIASGGQFYQWKGPNGFQSNLQSPVIPSVKFTDAGIYTVKVTTVEGCSDSGSLNMQVYPAATAVAPPEVFVCEEDSVRLQLSGGLRYQWLPKSGLSNDSIPNPNVSPKDTTLYYGVVTNQYGCSDTALVKVNVWRKPIADAGPDKKTRLGLPTQLNGAVAGNDVQYYWTPDLYMTGSGNLRPSVNPPQTMPYVLHAESRLGCGAATDTMIVKVYERVIVPNAFSPNGDGINDTWVIDPLEFFDEAVVEVFNRYGKRVYYTRGYSKPWDGTENGVPVPIGTYYYVIDMKIKKEPRITGWVFIVR